LAAEHRLGYDLAFHGVGDEAHHVRLMMQFARPLLAINRAAATAEYSEFASICHCPLQAGDTIGRVELSAVHIFISR
jgi:hypothetical protein